jgi:DNA-directed RNA polymerase subunit RPC12/RpoP
MTNTKTPVEVLLAELRAVALSLNDVCYGIVQGDDARELVTAAMDQLNLLNAPRCKWCASLRLVKRTRYLNDERYRCADCMAEFRVLGSVQP